MSGVTEDILNENNPYVYVRDLPTMAQIALKEHRRLVVYEDLRRVAREAGRHDDAVFWSAAVFIQRQRLRQANKQLNAITD